MSSKFREPVHDFHDGFYIIRGTKYYRPLFAETLIIWDDCEDNDSFAKKYIEDIKILQEHKKQLILF